MKKRGEATYKDQFTPWVDGALTAHNLIVKTTRGSRAYKVNEIIKRMMEK